MKKAAAILVLATLGALAGEAMAQQQGPWLVRARVVNIDPANKSDAGGPLALPANAITVSSKAIPEVDISYFLTPNIAAELILTYPQEHDVYLSGSKIGTFKHLPPTLTVQYHFAPAAQFSPYVGAGVNYTNISKVNLLNGGATLDNHSFGLALQAGVDFKLDKNWLLNLDVKKVQIRSDVYSGGATISRVKVDPLLVGLGVGYRF
ncbi:OmpW/AlkL family protein [Noviherbaspirillum galbum]|uniref:OmpW family protein n=1 Tax=Noviherbaspirillum galbum TaxID=2709383 RepID=A0A6B3SQX9_9BURK|nr:OmpW family outer membrane protein [Noviherbaspirillum galbum]NEX63174.1 OmpW family protein [Noviherbaspirillum galbum]